MVSQNIERYHYCYWMRSFLRLQSTLAGQNFHNLLARILPLTTNTVTQGILNLMVSAGLAQLKILGKDARYKQATQI